MPYKRRTTRSLKPGVLVQSQPGFSVEGYGYDVIGRLEEIDGDRARVLIHHIRPLTDELVRTGPTIEIPLSGIRYSKYANDFEKRQNQTQQ